MKKKAKKCLHKGRRAMCFATSAITFDNKTNAPSVFPDRMITLRCCSCREVIPLGRARVTGPQAENIADELRAAELVAIAHHTRGRNRFKRMTPDEFDWFVHGDDVAHCGERWPTTREEHAALLAHWIEEA